MPPPPHPLLWLVESDEAPSKSRGLLLASQRAAGRGVVSVKGGRVAAACSVHDRASPWCHTQKLSRLTVNSAPLPLVYFLESLSMATTSVRRSKD